MKSDKEWGKIHNDAVVDYPSRLKFIRDVQADALRHAAEIANDVDSNDGSNCLIVVKINEQADKLDS